MGQRCAAARARAPGRRVAVFFCYYLYKNIALLVADLVWMHWDNFDGNIAFADAAPPHTPSSAEGRSAWAPAKVAFYPATPAE